MKRTRRAAIAAALITSTATATAALVLAAASARSMGEHHGGTFQVVEARCIMLLPGAGEGEGREPAEIYA